mgnify:CR=1 FL=1|jgi:hypothetical protein
MELYTEIGNVYGLALSTMNLGYMFYCYHENDKAETLYTTALEIAKSVNYMPKIS